LANEKQPPKEQIKVTDKRIFTSDGDIREEFRNDIRPVDPEKTVEKPLAKESDEAKEQTASASTRAHEAPAAPSPQQPDQQTDRRAAGSADRRRGATMADRGANPGTPFANFLEPLIAQAYMSLGMLPNPYQQQAKPDVGAARQMIDILNLLQEKTKGNLTPEEEDFLTTYLGELKLAYVKITKNLA
jgi:hypothetical protein